MIRIERALFSVYDKSGVAEFAAILAAQGAELLASGGTAQALTAAGLPVTALESLTGFGELFAGRVKTLAPQVHGGILMRRDDPDDQRDAQRHAIRPIDLVCVNLYPFAETAADRQASRAACVEMIDIGGPALIRAAAKNHAHVVVVADPRRYAEIAALLRTHHGSVPRQVAAELAAEAYALTAAYDAAVYRYLQGTDRLPAHWAAGGVSMTALRYGENPGQRAACYVRGSGFWSGLQIHQGKAVSYNNLADLWAAWECLGEFEESGCVIIKHRTPCGIALDESMSQAFSLARDADPLSAFGGIVAVNRVVDAPAAALMAEMFLEVVAAPGWTPEASEILARRKNLRVVTWPPGGDARADEAWAFHSLGEATLVQERLAAPKRPGEWRQVTRAAVDPDTLAELFFAWRVVRHVRSNAIVLTRERRTIGIGSGQTSRIDACDNALMKAARAGGSIAGAVLASDAFFPFSDVVERAAAAGVRAIVQPGGSLHDADSIRACDEFGVSMLFTGERAFAH